MKAIKDMENLKKETKKALKQFSKKLAKRDQILTEEKANQAMRHTPTEKEQSAHDKFRKFLVTQEKFILIDIATILDIGKEQPTQAGKMLKTNRQIRTESKTFKFVLNEILETENLRDTLDQGLKTLEEQNVSV